jgi:ElaB/YqjD/DUF883 family membrane-anchored ribosome-binding protein
MNGKALEKRINRDIDRAKRDLSILRDDAVTGLSRKFGQMADGPKKSAVSAVKTVNKSIGQGLNQYNTKIQDVVDKVPGDLTRKAAGYPWVAVTMSLVLGLMVGAILRFSWHSVR